MKFSGTTAPAVIDNGDGTHTQVVHVDNPSSGGGSTADSTAANQQKEIDALGTAGTTPPTLPGGATGIQGFLRYLSSLLPVSIGRKAMNASLSVAVASDQTAIPVSGSAAVGEVPTLPPLSISGVDPNGAKRHFLTDAGGVQQVAVTNAVARSSVVYDPDGFRMEVATTARQTFSDDFGGTSLDATAWDVFPGGTYAPTSAVSGSGTIGSITYAVSGSALAVTMGTTLNSELWIVSKAMFALPLDLTAVFRLSQRLAENGMWVELVECDPTTGNLIGNANLAGDLRNRSGAYIGGTTTVGQMQLECVSSESPNIATALSSAQNSFTANQDLSLEFRALDLWGLNAISDINGFRSGNGVRLSLQAIEPDRMYKIRYRFKNIGTPASSTVITIGRVLAIDGQELTVEVIGGRGDTVAGRTIAASIVGSPGVIAGGNVAHGTAVAGNPVAICARGVSTQPTPVGSGASSYLQSDLAGRLVVKPGSIPQSQANPRIVLTATTETVLQALLASNRFELSTLDLVNTDTVDHIIDLRNTSAGGIVKTYLVKAGTMLAITFPWGFSQATLGANITVQMREAITTSGKAVEISATAHATTA